MIISPRSSPDYAISDVNNAKPSSTFKLGGSSFDDDDDEIEFLGSSVNSSLNSTPVSKVSTQSSDSQEPIDLVSDTDEEVKIVSATPKKLTLKMKPIDALYEHLSDGLDDDDDDENMYNDDDDEFNYGVSDEDHDAWDDMAEAETQVDSQDSGSEQDIDDAASFSSVAPSLESITFGDVSSDSVPARSVSPTGNYLESDAHEDLVTSSTDNIVPSIEEKIPADIAPVQKMKIDNIILPQDAPVTVVDGVVSTQPSYAEVAAPNDHALPPTPGQSPKLSPIPTKGFEMLSTHLQSPTRPPKSQLDGVFEAFQKPVCNNDTSSHSGNSTTLDEVLPITAEMLRAYDHATKDTRHVTRTNSLTNPVEKESLSEVTPVTLPTDIIAHGEVLIGNYAPEKRTLRPSELSIQSAVRLALNDHISTTGYNTSSSVLSGNMPHGGNSTPQPANATLKAPEQLDAFREKIKLARSGRSGEPVALLPSARPRPEYHMDNHTMLADAKDDGTRLKITAYPSSAPPRDAFLRFAGRVKAESTEHVVKEHTFVVTTPSLYSSVTDDTEKSSPETSSSKEIPSVANTTTPEDFSKDKKRRRTDEEEDVVVNIVAPVAKTSAAAIDDKTSEPSPKRARLTVPALKLPSISLPARGLSLGRLPAYKPLSIKWPARQKARNATASSAIVPVAHVSKETASATPTWTASVKPFLFGTLVGSVGIFGALLSMPELR